MPNAGHARCGTADMAASLLNSTGFRSRSLAQCHWQWICRAPTGTLVCAHKQWAPPPPGDARQRHTATFISLSLPWPHCCCCCVYVPSDTAHGAGATSPTHSSSTHGQGRRRLVTGHQGVSLTPWAVPGTSLAGASAGSCCRHPRNCNCRISGGRGLLHHPSNERGGGSGTSCTCSRIAQVARSTSTAAPHTWWRWCVYRRYATALYRRAKALSGHPAALQLQSFVLQVGLSAVTYNASLAAFHVRFAHTTAMCWPGGGRGGGGACTGGWGGG